MPQISNPRALWIASGFPRFVATPSPQYLIGKGTSPFAIQVTLANASAMATDLTLRGSWSTDRRVAAAYSISSSGDTSRLNAVLALSAVAIRVITFTDTVALASANAKLLSNATEPYLSGTIGGVPFRQSLKRGISHFVKRFESDQGTAADEIVGTLDQGIAVLAQPVRINMTQDALSLVSDAAVALGADAVASLELYGTLVPADADPDWQTFGSGAACNGGSADSSPLSSADELSSVRGMDVQYQTATAKF